MDYKKIDQIPIFFIVGVPRSGTTLLQQMLDANPSVITPFESGIIVFLKQKYFKKRNWTKADVNCFIEDLYNEPKFVNGWNIDKTYLTQLYHSIPLKDVRYDLLLKLAYYSYPSIYDKSEIKLLGDKNPLYSWFVDEVKEVFPEAKFIHIVRDYRANILSNRIWFFRKNISILAQKWVITNKFIENQKTKSPENFYTVRYEDLVDNPEKYAREIALFLNIDFDQNMLEHHKKATKVYSDPNAEKVTDYHRDFLGSLHENIVKPINKDRVDVWKIELTKEEIALADYISIPYAKGYHYEAMYSEKSFDFLRKALLAKIRITIDIFIIRIYQKFPGWIRKALRYFTASLYKLFGVTHIFNPELNRAKHSKSTN